jgi:hypothetical protein
MRCTLLIAGTLAVVACWPAPTPTASAQPAPHKGLAVHEWGVVSVYADVELANADMRDEWAGLPKFVYGQVDGRKQPEALRAVKAPVIYFHLRQPLSLGVTVNFPGGKPAVWWPTTMPNFNGQPLTSLNWRVELKPKGDIKYAALPKGHWMEALRQVEADDVLVYDHGPEGGAQFERFIYYDGLIPVPKGLEVQVQGDTISLKSTAKHPLLDVTVVDLRNLRRIRTATIAKLDPEGEVKEVKLTEREQTKWPYDGIAELVGQLKAAGLNEDEAKSLVAVWRKAFFETEGLGVFYRLPQEVYDRLLPLTVQPTPEQTVRTLLVHHPHCEPDLRERVLTLVKDLGAIKFEDRVEAQRRLTALGKAAFIHLARARNDSMDPEVKARLTRVLEEFEAEKGFGK